MRGTISTLALVAASIGLMVGVPAMAAKKKMAPAAAAPAPALEAATAALLDTALAGEQRTAEEKARDVYRHPKEALAFYGLTSKQTVIEVSPGTGWWTDVLAPVLRDNGKLIVAMNADVNGPGRGGLGSTLTRYAALPKAFDKVEIAHYAPSKGVKIGADGAADMVLVFRHMHGLVGNNIAPQALKLYYDALKPGGVLAIEQHRWPEAKAMPIDAKTGKPETIGYLKESDVIALATAAGFKFVAKSEINANPKDTKDYKDNVWSLPPTLRGGDVDKEKFLAIGESDRMTMKFIKPVM
jgi:predicted methyltransferase